MIKGFALFAKSVMESCFDKDKLPLDHPNGRCTFFSVFNKSATQISDEMAAWVKGKEGDFPKLDEYMKKKFGTDRYEKAMQMAQQGMKQEGKPVYKDFVPKNAKELSEKYGIDCSGIKGDAVKNIDRMLSVFREDRKSVV